MGVLSSGCGFKDDPFREKSAHIVIRDSNVTF